MVMLEDRQKYYDRLAQHDWFYEMSSDNRAYTRGESESSSLRYAAAHSVELAELYDAYANFKFKSGPKPERPT